MAPVIVEGRARQLRMLNIFPDLVCHVLTEVSRVQMMLMEAGADPESVISSV